MARPNEVAVRLMEHLCNHDWHGYDQTHRLGDGEGTCPVVVDGRTYELQQGDRDCSSAVIECWKMPLAGTLKQGALDKATYTGNIRSVFVKSGLFEWKPMSFTAQPGDLYLAEGQHVAMCLSTVPDMLGEFSINEKGKTTGGKVGDQTGRESRVRDFYSYPWDGILHYTGGDLGAAPGVSATPPSVPYRVKTAEDGWLPWMDGLVSSDGSGEDYAGEIGHAIIDVEWDAPEGSWSTRTLADGTELARDEPNTTGQPLSGVTLYYVTPNPGVTGFFKAKYRVGRLGGDYLKWEHDDEDGGAGGAGVIDRLQLSIEQ